MNIDIAEDERAVTLVKESDPNPVMVELRELKADIHDLTRSLDHSIDGRYVGFGVMNSAPNTPCPRKTISRQLVPLSRGNAIRSVGYRPACSFGEQDYGTRSCCVRERDTPSSEEAACFKTKNLEHNGVVFPSRYSEREYGGNLTRTGGAVSSVRADYCGSSRDVEKVLHRVEASTTAMSRDKEAVTEALRKEEEETIRLLAGLRDAEAVKRQWRILTEASHVLKQRLESSERIRARQKELISELQAVEAEITFSTATAGSSMPEPPYYSKPSRCLSLQRPALPPPPPPRPPPSPSPHVPSASTRTSSAQCGTSSTACLEAREGCARKRGELKAADGGVISKAGGRVRVRGPALRLRTRRERHRLQRLDPTAGRNEDSDVRGFTECTALSPRCRCSSGNTSNTRRRPCCSSSAPPFSCMGGASMTQHGKQNRREQEKAMAEGGSTRRCRNAVRGASDKKNGSQCIIDGVATELKHRHWNVPDGEAATVNINNSSVCLSDSRGRIHDNKSGAIDQSHHGRRKPQRQPRCASDEKKINRDLLVSRNTVLAATSVRPPETKASVTTVARKRITTAAVGTSRLSIKMNVSANPKSKSSASRREARGRRRPLPTLPTERTTRTITPSRSNSLSRGFWMPTAASAGKARGLEAGVGSKKIRRGRKGQEGWRGGAW